MNNSYQPPFKRYRAQQQPPPQQGGYQGGPQEAMSEAEYAEQAKAQEAAKKQREEGYIQAMQRGMAAIQEQTGATTADLFRFSGYFYSIITHPDCNFPGKAPEPFHWGMMRRAAKAKHEAELAAEKK